MVQSPLGAINVLASTLYIVFLALMISGWIYLMVKLGEISRNVAAMAGQQESQSRSLAYLAESVAALAKAAAAPKSEPEPEPPARLEP